MKKYKLKLMYGDTELIITISRNRVVDYNGSSVLKALVQPYFEKPIGTLTGELTNHGDHTTVHKIFKPGMNSFIDAVLSDIIQNELEIDYELYTEDNNI